MMLMASFGSGKLKGLGAILRKYYLAYLGYPPLFFAGPILSYNAFVSQLEKPILSYSAGMAPDNEQAKRARHGVIYYGIRVLILMVPALLIYFGLA